MDFTSRHVRFKNRSSKLRPSKHKSQELLSSFIEDPHEGLKIVLGNICQEISNGGQLLNYLNCFVKLTLKIEAQFKKFGYLIEDVLNCLIIPLTNLSTQVRAAALRSIRHVLTTEKDVIQLDKLLIPFLITRSLDLYLKNDQERVEAMKLMRKILIISPMHFNVTMARSLVSLANSGIDEKDKLLRVCLATLTELGVLNSKLFILSGGVAAITRNLLECQTPKIAQSLCGVLLLLLDKPITRDCALVDLNTVAAPFCDFHYKHGWRDKNKRDERELRLNCSRLALLTILKSWPGIIHFCNPNNKGGLKAIIDALYLNQLEVRKAVLDLLYELIGLPLPEWTDELSVALGAVDPCEPQATWRLTEGFIVAEGCYLLPHLAKTTPSIIDMHLALLLYCFIENGLLGALIEVIATSDTFISVRATVLLGELLRLTQIYLPPECCSISPSLPSLIDYATKCKPQAMGAVSALQRLHKLMKKRPASYSLHLDFILQCNFNKEVPKLKTGTMKLKNTTFKSKLNQFVAKDEDDFVKETGVLLNMDALTWNWGLINIILKSEDGFKLNLMDTSHRSFLKRLLEFFMPSKNRYSHMDLTPTKLSHMYTTTGIKLINFLTDLKDTEFTEMVLEFFRDVLVNIAAITAGRSVHDCLFSPQHMVNTQCQSYFLFIGRFLTTQIGMALLGTLDVFKKLDFLATNTAHDCYVKLIISSLDYTAPSKCRELLDSILTCDIENSRLYATQFLLVLLRAGTPNFSEWGIRFLVRQLRDTSPLVKLTVLKILQEACEIPECLESIVSLNPELDTNQDSERLLEVKFLGNENGFNMLHKGNFIFDQIRFWDRIYIVKYVKLVESDILETFTLRHKREDDIYDRRATFSRLQNQKNIFLPPHLYGQLNQHSEGLKLLKDYGSISSMIQIIKNGSCNTDQEILKLKSALWALGHLSTSLEGCNLLILHGIIDDIVKLAESSSVYSVRATTYYVLGLVATTAAGVNELIKQGWFSTRHSRHEYWPTSEDTYGIIEPVEVFRNRIEPIHVPMPPSLQEYSDLDDSSLYNWDITECSDDEMSKHDGFPLNRQNIYHMRSFSESKSFELRGSEEKIKEKDSIRSYRDRYNSMTESSTSGIDSCDSLQGCKGGTCLHLQVLNTIPSSSSLTTLRKNSASHQKKEPIFSETSEINSNTCFPSLDEAYSHLYLHTKRPYSRSRSSASYNEQLSRTLSDSSSNSLDVGHSRVSEDFSVMENTFVNLFKVQKFAVQVNCTNSDKSYMGITLPQVLLVLFTGTESKMQPAYMDCPETDFLGSYTCSEASSSKLYKHDVDICFACSRSQGKRDDFCEEKDPVAIEVMKNAEKLANPVWNKYVKQIILQRKQREPSCFRDICVYSEICKIMSHNVYRLSSRRLLQELFLDVSFNSVHEIIVKSSLRHVKTLDILKFTYNENKFPIRNN